MFGFSKRDKKPLCPIPEERRQWLGYAFDWLVSAFGEDPIRKADDGKYHIALEERKLRQPEFMVATLAHELAHIKLLGEERLEENDEQITDLTTVAFGLGVFNANAAFTTFQDFRSHGWQKLGYLKQMDWGYVLALFARLREENDPEWAKHLSKNVKSDFAKSYGYLSSL